MRSEGFCEQWRRVILQSIPTTDDRPQVRRLSLSRTQLCRFKKRVRDDGTARRPETIVVEFEDLEGAVLSQERDDWVCGAATKCVIT